MIELEVEEMIIVTECPLCGFVVVEPGEMVCKECAVKFVKAIEEMRIERA